MAYEHPLIRQSKLLAVEKKYKDKDGNLDPEKIKFIADATKSKLTKHKRKKFNNLQEEVDDFIIFVGFRGYFKGKKPIIDLTYTPKWITRDANGVIIKETVIPLEIEFLLRKQGMEIVRDYKHPFHAGQAHPPPIDEKGNELGILPHEVEAYIKIRKNLKKGIMFKWFRGAGKTYVVTWTIEWTMDRLGYPWLYLSETAIMNDVAYWIWQWAKKERLITHAEKGDKQNTYTQFELTSGGVLRIFKYMDEAPTGQHGWYIAMDDIIKKGWQDRPSDNDRAKRQWNYAHNFIRRKGLLIVGTRKFEGDPLEHLEQVVPDIYIDILVPYVMKGNYPDWEITFDENGLEVLSVPELYNHEDLEAKKVKIAEESDEDPIIAWNAEMMQDPRPSAGGLCSPEDIYYTNRPFFTENVQMVGIGVDLMWEDEKSTSDMAAVVSMIMHQVEFDKKRYKRFTAIRADVYRMPLYDTVRDGKLVKGVFTIIGEHYKYLRMHYSHIHLIIAIERNSGGMVIIKVAQREKFKWIPSVVSDRKEAVKAKKNGTANIPLGITHRKNKVSRVYGELKNSIPYIEEHKGHEMQFDWSLEGSTLITQLTGFPKAKHDDGPDATGMIKDELNARYTPYTPKRKPREIVKEEKKMAKHQQDFLEKQAMPWLADQKRHKLKTKRLERKRLIKNAN